MDAATMVRVLDTLIAVRVGEGLVSCSRELAQSIRMLQAQRAYWAAKC